MAADSREPSTASTSPSPSSSSQSPSTSTTKHPTIILPPPSANAFPRSASQNTAGSHGAAPQATLLDAVRTLNPSEITSLPQKPCVRDALLFGMASGFGIGGLRAIIATSGHGSFKMTQVVWKAFTWAMGSFCFGSAGMWEFCKRRRDLEAGYMRRAREVMERKKVEKEREMEEKRARRREERDRREREDEERRRREKENKPGWKFW